MPKDIEPPVPNRSSAPYVRSRGNRFPGSRGSAIVQNRRTPGFSLIELMVAIVVFAILLLVGVPSMQTLLMNNRMTSRMNALSASLQMVRAEAIKRNATAALVPGRGCTGSGNTSSGTGNLASSGGGCANENWADGWTAYAERNQSPGPDLGSDSNDASCVEIDRQDVNSYSAGAGAATSARDCLLWREEASKDLNVKSRGNTPTSVSEVIRIEFGGAGSPVCRTSEANSENACYFVFCDSRGSSFAHSLLLSASGHLRVSRTNPQNQLLTCPNDEG